MRNKKILTLVFVVAFLTLLVGCYPSDPVKLTEIIVSPDKITMLCGTTLQLKVTAVYDDGNHGDITSDCVYESSNSFIVIVNTSEGSEGEILGIAPGKATIITVDCYEGLCFSDTAEVTVRVDAADQIIKIIR